MKQIQVNASKSYTVTIGSGVLTQLGSIIRSVSKAQKVCIVSDSNVWPLYGNAATESCLASGLPVCHFVFFAGENRKNSCTYLELLNFLANNQISRNDCIVALGGGVVGDLAGFAAATYLRGIPYIQAPTSLLAMVDSSVGGKTAIDLPAGKNLVGAFYQPSAVLCDIDTLDTLPEDIIRDGCAEVVKYAVLFDPELFELLEKDGLIFDRETVTARCIEHKRNVVAQDEFDKGQRMLLNLGHTMGHAIEKRSDYKISHGKAVSIGMAMVCRAIKCQDTDRIIALLEKFGLPTATDLPTKELFKVALSDKKRSGEAVNLIVPRIVGDCAIVPTPVKNLKTFIEEGM